MPEEIARLAQELSNEIGEDPSVDRIDDTYEVDADNFTLSFTLDDERFEIRNINTHGNGGVGRRLISVIHSFADQTGREVLASNVEDTAIGFWQKMGYEQGSTDSEYYRI